MKKMNCNLCGSDKFEFLFTGQDRLLKIDTTKFDLVKCKNCGLVFINPQPTAEELVKYYPAQYGPYQDSDQIFKYGFLSSHIKAVMDQFKKKSDQSSSAVNIFDGDKVNYLDFGCGGGAQLEQEKKKHPAWNFYGSDISKIACATAESKGFKVFCGDILELDLPENFFNEINMSHVIEHLNNPKAVLVKLNKTLKNGGKIKIATPNFDSCAARLFKQYWYALDMPRHLFLFTPKTLSRMLVDSGFVIKKIEFDRGPKVAIRSLYYLFGKKDLKINPFLWRFFKPIAIILAYFGKTSIMAIYAEK